MPQNRIYQNFCGGFFTSMSMVKCKTLEQDFFSGYGASFLYYISKSFLALALKIFILSCSVFTALRTERIENACDTKG